MERLSIADAVIKAPPPLGPRAGPMGAPRRIDTLDVIEMAVSGHVCRGDIGGAMGLIRIPDSQVCSAAYVVSSGVEKSLAAATMVTSDVCTGPVSTAYGNDLRGCLRRG